MGQQAGEGTAGDVTEALDLWGSVRSQSLLTFSPEDEPGDSW